MNATAPSVPPGTAAVPGLVHGPASPLVDTKRTSARIATSDATVLLTGETGTGKEVFARFIHSESRRTHHAFVPVNCGAIPETLMESELFGYVKGAFTGAIAARRGRVAMANGGTLFLDEIGELPLSLQVKLLRLLQEKTYEPIGSSESVAASFRLIAATNRDLVDEVRAGRFRSDLYYRLHVCPIRLPALRERRSDIMPLFHHFWSRRGETRPVEAAVIQCLESYGWPGNVRELENLVERVSVCTEGDVIRLDDLPLGIRAPHLDGVGEELGGLAMASFAGVGPAASVPPPLVFPAAAPVVEAPLAVAPRPVPDLLDVTATGDADGEAEAALPDAISLAAMAAEVRAAATGSSGMSASLPAGEPRGTGNTPTPALQLPIDLPTMLRELENAYINAALTQTGSNKKEAARLLGMGRTTLVEKLRRRASDARTKDE